MLLAVFLGSDARHVLAGDAKGLIEVDRCPSLGKPRDHIHGKLLARLLFRHQDFVLGGSCHAPISMAEIADFAEKLIPPGF